MLQKEVVQRMSAAPETPDYGRLSVMLQARFRVERLFIVPAGAFRPAPKVESAVARLTPLARRRPRIDDEALFAQIVAAAFGQRRKTLRNALRACGNRDVPRSEASRPARAAKRSRSAISCGSRMRWRETSGPRPIGAVHRRADPHRLAARALAAKQRHVAQRHAERIGQETQ